MALIWTLDYRNTGHCLHWIQEIYQENYNHSSIRHYYLLTEMGVPEDDQYGSKRVVVNVNVYDVYWRQLCRLKTPGSCRFKFITNDNGVATLITCLRSRWRRSVVRIVANCSYVEVKSYGECEVPFRPILISDGGASGNRSSSSSSSSCSSSSMRRRNMNSRWVNPPELWTYIVLCTETNRYALCLSNRRFTLCVVLSLNCN
jgi:hypothetical protein